jgi:hypothetical protein
VGAQYVYLADRLELAAELIPVISYGVR